MFGFLLAILILDGVLLMVVILLQSGKGGGLASMGGGAGTDTFIGGRQAATILTKATWAMGGSFLALSLLLAVLSSRQQRPQSILRDEFKQSSTPAAPQPVLPGVQTAPAPAGGAAAPAGSAPAEAPPAGTGTAPIGGGEQPKQ